MQLLIWYLILIIQFNIYYLFPKIWDASRICILSLHRVLATLLCMVLNLAYNPSKRVPIKIGITVTFIFRCFFSSLIRSQYFSLFPLSFSFTLWSAGTAKSTVRQVLFFFVGYHTIGLSGRNLIVRLDLPPPLLHQIWESNFLGQILGCAYTISLNRHYYLFFSFLWTFIEWVECSPNGQSLVASYQRL